MESRQRHTLLLSFIILSIHHVVFCETAQCGGCTYSLRPFSNINSNIGNCNPCVVATKNCDPGQFTLTMNVPVNDGCLSSRTLPCSEPCGTETPLCSCSSTQPVTKLFLLPNQPCPCPSPPVSCLPTCSPLNSPAVSCCPSFPSICPQSSLPSVILPPSVPLPQPLCLQTSFPLPNVGIVQPDPTIAQCNDVDFVNLIGECWNDIPRVYDLPPLRKSCVDNGCQGQVPVLLQIQSQEANNCDSTSYPQIIIQKSDSKLGHLLPIIMIAMLSGNNNNFNSNSYSYGGGRNVIPFPYPIPIPYNCFAAEY